MSQTQVNRDPFARASLMRRTVEKGLTCEWCGQPAKFEYAWERDCKNTVEGWSKPFCSVGCYRTYYELR